MGDTFYVDIASHDRIICARIERRESDPPRLDFSADEIGEQSFEGSDLFECMRALRRYLESRAMLLLCNGARVDAFPSAMSRQMGNARRVYITELGKHAVPEARVDIFDPAPVEKVGSVDEQTAFHQEWLRSLGWEI